MRGRAYAGSQLRRPRPARRLVRELNLAVTLRANEASILYNAACVYCGLKKKPEALDALRKAGKRDSRSRLGAARSRPRALHGEPEFERLYPESRPANLRRPRVPLRRVALGVPPALGSIALSVSVHPSAHVSQPRQRV